MKIGHALLAGRAARTRSNGSKGLALAVLATAQLVIALDYSIVRHRRDRRRAGCRLGDRLHRPAARRSVDLAVLVGLLSERADQDPRTQAAA